jgi:site-specific DNA recombinase
MDREDLEVIVIRQPGATSADAMLYDPMPGGSGLIEQLCARFREVTAVAKGVVENCPSICERSCVDCLQSFRNGFYHRYARYSSDQQREASIDDQLRDCRAYADRQGWKIVQEYADAAKSGSNTTMRPDFQALMTAAHSKRFDIVLSESLDRLSRDQEDTAHLYKKLSFLGVRIVTIGEGDIGQLTVGFKGTMNAIYLTDLSIKTRRGLRGRAEAGKSAGGVSYGYRVVRRIVDGGKAATGERAIDPDQAAIVERIFTEFNWGISPQAIAKRLNAEGVKGPNQGAWGPSTLHGHAKRGTGILNNELYVGRQVWNPAALCEESRHRQARLSPQSSC